MNLSKLAIGLVGMFGINRQLARGVTRHVTSVGFVQG